VVREWGEATAFFSRLLPIVRTFISLPAGVARMNFTKFTILTFIGSFIWSWGLTVGGFLWGSRWEELRAIMRPFDIPIAIVLLILVALYIYRHVKHERDYEEAALAD